MVIPRTKVVATGVLEWWYGQPVGAFGLGFSGLPRVGWWTRGLVGRGAGATIGVLFGV